MTNERNLHNGSEEEHVGFQTRMYAATDKSGRPVCEGIWVEQLWSNAMLLIMEEWK